MSENEDSSLLDFAQEHKVHVIYVPDEAGYWYASTKDAAMEDEFRTGGFTFREALSRLKAFIEDNQG